VITINETYPFVTHIFCNG